MWRCMMRRADRFAETWGTGVRTAWHEAWSWYRGPSEMISLLFVAQKNIGDWGSASTNFEDVGPLKSPPCLSSFTLCVFEVLGEFVWWSYWRGLVGYVVFAEGGVVVLEMEEMFLRRLVVVLCEKKLFFVFKSCQDPRGYDSLWYSVTRVSRWRWW